MQRDHDLSFDTFRYRSRIAAPLVIGGLTFFVLAFIAQAPTEMVYPCYYNGTKLYASGVMTGPDFLQQINFMYMGDYARCSSCPTSRPVLGYTLCMFSSATDNLICDARPCFSSTMYIAVANLIFCVLLSLTVFVCERSPEKRAMDRRIHFGQIGEV